MTNVRTQLYFCTPGCHHVEMDAAEVYLLPPHIDVVAHPSPLHASNTRIRLYRAGTVQDVVGWITRGYKISQLDFGQLVDIPQQRISGYVTGSTTPRMSINDPRWKIIGKLYRTGKVGSAN